MNVKMISGNQKYIATELRLLLSTISGASIHYSTCYDDRGWVEHSVIVTWSDKP